MNDPDFLCLPNPVGPCYGLLLVLGVRVRVVHHDCVGGLQVQAPPRSPDAQQEDEDFAVRSIEAFDGCLPAASRLFTSAGCSTKGIHVSRQAGRQADTAGSLCTAWCRWSSWYPVNSNAIRKAGAQEATK